MPLFKVVDGKAPDWHPQHQLLEPHLLTLTGARLIFYSKEKHDLAEFFRGTEAHITTMYPGDIYVYCGRYTKTRGIGKTEKHDSMNLRHNGWMDGVLRFASVSLPIPEAVQTAVESALPHILATSRYFVGFQLFDVSKLGSRLAKRMTEEPALLYNQGSTRTLLNARDVPFSSVSAALEARGWRSAITDLP